MLSYKYSSWDGMQELDIDAEDILKALSDDVLEGGDLKQALRRLTQRGMRGQNLMGLQEMLQRLKNRRQQELDQHNLGSVVDDLQKALEEILRLEREGIDRKVENARNRVQPETGQDSQVGEQGDPQQGQEGEQGQDGQEGQQGQQPPSGQQSPMGASQRGQWRQQSGKPGQYGQEGQ